MNTVKEKLRMKDIEINELNGKVTNAQKTIAGLHDCIARLEDKINQDPGNQNQPNLSHSRDSPLPHFSGRTLLLGDTNLSQMRPNDLSEKCSVRTINGANIDLLKCWIAEKLSWVPNNCIIYCGIQDLLDNVSISILLDNLGALISTLKEKNEDMIIYVCELVPSLKEDENLTKIKNYNKGMIEWCFKNNINIIKTDLPFRLGTGELDEMCFTTNEDTSDVTLNRFGVLRLLNTISKQYPDINLCSDAKELKLDQNPPRNIRYNRSDNMHLQQNNPVKQYRPSTHNPNPNQARDSRTAGVYNRSRFGHFDYTQSDCYRKSNYQQNSHRHNNYRQNSYRQTDYEQN